MISCDKGTIRLHGDSVQVLGELACLVHTLKKFFETPEILIAIMTGLEKEAAKEEPEK